MSTKVTTRHVQLCIQEQRLWLRGQWQWELQSDSVYCSDVMSFPDDFEGTRSIIHPDDITNVKKALLLLSDGETLPLQFRIITTYGQVKTLTGEQVTLDGREPLLLPAEEHQPWETALEAWTNPKEEAQLRLRTELSDTLERLYSLGSWYINAETNEAFYSDNLFRLHGMVPQGLNVHANTFNVFIHPEDQLIVTEALDKAFIHRVPVHLNYRIVKANGEERQVQLVTSWRFNAFGQQLLTGLLQDVTELQVEADKLAEAQVHLLFQKSILQLNEQNTNSGNWYINLFTRKTTYSDNYFRIYGLKQQMLPNYNSFLNLVHPDDRDAVKEAIDRMYQEHVLPEMEYRIIRPDGKTRYLRQAGKLMVHGGKDLLVAGTVQDITMQKTLEQQMKELRAEVQLRNSIYELAEDLARVSAIVWYLPDGNMHWTDGFFKMLGYKPGALEPSERLLYRSLHPADLKAFKQAVTHVLNNEPHDPIQFRIITRAGISEVQLSFRHLQHQPVIVGIAQDISAQSTLRQQVAERTGYVTLLSNTIPDSIIVTSTDHTILAWNGQAEKKTGIKESEALNENLFEVLPRLKDEDYVMRLQHVLQGQDTSFLQLRDGYYKGYYDLHLAPLRNAQNEVTSVLHVVHDISRERELQARLGERLNFIENLVEASVDRIIVLDRNMNYLYWNRQAELYYNLAKERVLGKNIMEVFPAFRTDPTYQEFRRVLKGETVHLSAHLEAESTEYYETYLIPIKDEKEGVLAVLWIVHDLSNERQLQQEQLRTLQMLQEEHYRLVEAQAIVHIGSYEYDLTAGTFAFSDEMFRLFGKEPQSFTPTLDWIDSVSHPDDARAVRALLDKAIAGKTDYEYQRRIYRPGGDTRFLFSRGRVVCDETGKAVKIAGTAHDVTEQKKTDTEIRARQELLQATMNSSMEMIQVFEAVRDVNGVIVDFTWVLNNHKAETFYGDVIGKSLLQLQPGIVEQGIFNTFKHVVESGIPDQSERHYTHEQFDGWFYQSVVKLNDGVATTTTDITERKAAAEKLKDNKAFIEEITLNTPDLITIHDINNNIIYANHTDFWNGLFDGNDVYRVKEEQRAEAMIADEDLEKAKAFVAARKRLKDDEVNEVELKMKQGRWIRVRSKVFKRDDQGNASQAISFTTDITKQKIAEQESQNAKETLQAILDSTLHIIQMFKAVRDNAGRIVDFVWLMHNEKGIEQNGDVIGQSLLQINPGVIASGLFNQFVQVTETGVPIDQDVYYNFGQFNGWFHQTLVKMGDGFVMNAIDITERKKAEQEILRLKDEVADKVSDKYRTLFNSMDEGYCIIQMIYDKNGEAVDWRFLEVNPAFEKHNGLVYATGKTVRELTPGIESKWIAIYNRVAQSGESIRLEEESEALQRVFDLYAFRVGAPEERKVAVLFTDITQRKKAERALCESEQKARALNSLVPVLLWNVDAKGKETTLNERWLEYTGQTVEESQDGGWMEFINPDDRLHTQHILAGAFANPHMFELEQRIRRHDGVYRWFLMRQVPIVNDKGEVVQWFGAAVDIHDRKLAEEALHQAEDAIKHQQQAELFKNLNLLKQAEEVASIGSWEYCTGQDVLQWSEGMYRLFELEPSAKVQKETYLEYTVEEERSKAKALVQQLSEGAESIDEVLTIETRAGTRKVLRVKGILVNDAGRPPRMLGVDLDITDLVRTGESLRTLNQALDQRNKDLEATNEELANFSFIASHDLREPLRKIHTFSDWLLQREKENVSELGQNYLKRMASSVERMDVLIDDVLVLTRLHASSYEPEDVDLNAVLQSVKTELKDVLRKHHVHMRADALPVIPAHKSQVHQLFKNLISNAIKFQPPGNSPHITITYSDVPATEIVEQGLPVDRSYVKVCVSDNGIGIDKRYARKIFQIFQRLHSRTEYEGTGIGLTICKKVMENHNGMITVESTPGKGSTFSCYFQVPAP